MSVKIEHIEWPDRPDVMMPYSPAIKTTGGSLLFFAGVTAAPVYHSHPHIPAEFENIPPDMASQARMTMENLKKSVEAAGGTLQNVVHCKRFLTDLERPGRPQQGVERVHGRLQADLYHGAGGAARHRSPLPARDRRHRGHR